MFSSRASRSRAHSNRSAPSSSCCVNVISVDLFAYEYSDAYSFVFIGVFKHHSWTI